MKLRLSLLAIVLAVIAFVVVQSLPHTKGKLRNASAPEMTPTVDFTTLPRDSSLRLDALRERLLAPYRLRPDRRLALAVTAIRRLAGAPDSAVTVQFAAGHWTVMCGQTELGKLAEMPDFPEMLQLLTECARKQAWSKGWADNVGPDRPELAAALDRLDAPAALRAADQAWTSGARDAALFRDASHAYSMLALETPGAGEASDPIVSRAFAMLAYARALGADDPKREACLLADVMGYSVAATELGRHLAARDPLRLYVTWDDPALDRMARAVVEPLNAPPPAAAPSAAASTHARTARRTTTAKAAPRPVAAKPTLPSAMPALHLEAPFFDLLRLASRGDYEHWFDLLSDLDLPGVPDDLLLGTGLRIQHPEPSRLVAERVLESATTPRAARKPMGARSDVPAGMGSSLGQQLQRVENALAQRSRPKGGVLFPADLSLAQDRALLYAALDKVAEGTMEWLSPAEKSRWFAPGPKKSGAGKRAAQFQRWYAHLAQASVGKPNLTALEADVDSMAPGPAAALRSFEALRPYVSSSDDALRNGARDLARQMDSRPDHRLVLARIAERDLLALSLADRLEASVAAVQGAADEPEDSAPGPSEPDSATLARKVIAHPTRWDASQQYASFLEKHKDYAAARRVIERWMARSPADTSGRTAAGMESRIQLARLVQLDGHPDEALRLIGDLDRSGYFPAMERRALVLQELGQTNQALAIAWTAHRRNPPLAAGRGLLAELFWRQGRVDDAAKALKDGPALSGAAWMLEVAPRFVAYFKLHPTEGLAAAEALMRAGFNDRNTFGTIPDALGEEGVHDFAFELQSRMRLSGAQQIESLLLAYGHLAAAKGEPVALAWLQGRVPVKDREALAILAYQEGHPELLWSMAPSHLDTERSDYQWLLRAAVCMRAGAKNEHYEETANHVDRAHGTYHVQVAKYLLGLSEESEVLALVPQSLQQRAEIYYFIGLKNEQSGHFHDAADWYLMSVESGDGSIESRWAMDRLRQWSTEGRPEDRVAPAKPPAA